MWNRPNAVLTSSNFPEHPPPLDPLATLHIDMVAEVDL